MDQGTKDVFSQLLVERDKQEFLEENWRNIEACNDRMIYLAEKDASLIEQEKMLRAYSSVNNLAYDSTLQKLFEERQADITEKIDEIISQQNNSELKKPYENIKLQEEEIKSIQEKIEVKNQIIKQSKQKEEELFAKLEQLQQESLTLPLSPKQHGEEIVSQYTILQERANDFAASIKSQIELNKLNNLVEHREEQINIERNKVDIKVVPIV